MTKLRSHVTGTHKGVEVSFYISHDAKLIENAFCAAFFALTGEVFSEKPRDYHVHYERGSVKPIYFKFKHNGKWSAVEINVIGRDTE